MGSVDQTSLKTSTTVKIDFYSLLEELVKDTENSGSKCCIVTKMTPGKIFLVVREEIIHVARA